MPLHDEISDGQIHHCIILLNPRQYRMYDAGVCNILTLPHDGGLGRQDRRIKYQLDVRRRTDLSMTAEKPTMALK